MQRLRKIKNNLKTDQSSESSLQLAKSVLKQGIYSIQAINKSVNKRILSMFYSPGVGECCMAIKNNLSMIDQLTLRGRSVAIVSDGQMLNSQGKKFMPVMDWLIAQIKFYSQIDCFPFVLRKNADLQAVLEDLSTCYGTILYLDYGLQKKIKKIPENLLIINQQDIANISHMQITDAEGTAKVLMYLLEEGIKGLASEQLIRKGLKKDQIIINPKNSYDEYINTGDLKEQSIKIHKHYRGKIEIGLSINNIYSLKRIFTLQNLKRIVQQENVLSKTQSLCAIVTDGTAILGYGDIGPQAGLPVMEGKSLLFKLLGQVQVVPVCIKKRKTSKQTVQAILDLLYYSKAINLQDFKAPECFDIQNTLSNKAIMPVFHDDQHGTAIVVLAGLINAIKLAKKDKQLQKLKIVLNGAGAAGITIARILHGYGISNIIVCDRAGAIYPQRKQNMNNAKKQIGKLTNPNNQQGSLQRVINDADIFIGVSSKNALKKQWVKKMKKDPIIFALANPDPQISEKDAKQAGCYIYGSGRSDFCNQINNSLVFPGVFKGIIKHNLQKITDEMKIQSAIQIAKIAALNLNQQYIIPDSLNKDVALKISEGLQKYK